MPASSHHPERLKIELCAGGIDDVILGARHGVDRIELNSGMTAGGLTPSAGLAAAARDAFTGPIIAMVRPREGGFAYSKAEYIQMLDDCEQLVAAGIEGIAVGFLTPVGTVERERCRKLRTLFPGATLVFHRAFDVVRDPEAALSLLVDCGFDRILTSGGMARAIEGAAMLRRLSEIAAGRIEILPAGGIRASNVVTLITQTGCNQIHTAVRDTASDSSTQHNPRIQFGVAASDNGSYGQASANLLQGLLNAVLHLRTLPPGAQGS